LKNDNSNFQIKIDLRKEAIKKINNPVVLECYSGTGKLWDHVIKETEKKIKILRIEKEKQKGSKIYLQGDNLKYLNVIDLSKFNVIDLDAYGIPFDQINILHERNYNGIVIVTAIQTMTGALPNRLLYRLGYTKEMIKKTPSLFYRNGLDKLKNYLYLIGVKEIKGYFIDRKNYFMFNLNH
jgi:hypothetical protein